jgi:transposase InsO family protein
LLSACAACRARPPDGGSHHHPRPAAPARTDLIRRDFTAAASRLSTRWCGDITDVSTGEGWLYLSVIDIASRRVSGHATADHLRTELTADALAHALATRHSAPGVIFYAAAAASTPPPDTPPWPRTTASSCRTDEPGSAENTSWPKGFFGVIKGELPGDHAWPGRATARHAVTEYIAWYKGTRLHSAPRYRAPAEYEAAARQPDPQAVA